MTPVSHPAIPSTANHPLWRAWDLTVDSILFELPDIISGMELEALSKGYGAAGPPAGSKREGQIPCGFWGFGQSPTYSK